MNKKNYLKAKRYTGSVIRKKNSRTVVLTKPKRKSRAAARTSS